MTELLCTADDRTDQEIVTDYIYQNFDHIISKRRNNAEETIDYILSYVPIYGMRSRKKNISVGHPVEYSISIRANDKQKLNALGKLVLAEAFTTGSDHLYHVIRDSVTNDRTIMIDIGSRYYTSPYLTVGV